MSLPLVLVSGFGSFERFDSNPSGAVARALEEAPPAGMRVRSAVLPVSFARSPLALEQLLAGAGTPALYLGLGVHRRAGFRLERAAGPRLKCVPRPDVDGRGAAEFSRDEPRLLTAIDLARLLSALRRRGVADARISRTAGGFVCEWIYYHLLKSGSERGVPALFVHVPALERTPLERQIQVVGWVLEEALRAASAPGAPRAPGAPAAPAAKERRRR